MDLSLHLVRCDAAHHFAVDHNYRRQPAGSEAARGEHAQFVIWRGLPGLHTFFRGDGGQQAGGALDVASRASAHDTCMFALRLHREVVIERGRAVDSAQRDLQHSGYVGKSGLIQVSETRLQGVQRFDQCVPLISKLSHRGRDNLPPLVVRRWLGFYKVGKHRINTCKRLSFLTLCSSRGSCTRDRSLCCMAHICEPYRPPWYGSVASTTLSAGPLLAYVYGEECIQPAP